MGRTFLQGAVVLVAGIVALLLNEVLNLGLGSIAFGLAIGAILGFGQAELLQHVDGFVEIALALGLGRRGGGFGLGLSGHGRAPR